jgi:hypothetical protein
MEHLFGYSVYQDLSELGDDVDEVLRRTNCDGFEMLTSHTPVEPQYIPHTVSVHLPFATDWLAPWEGRAYDMDEYFAKYYMYGRDREEVVCTVKNMIDYAAVIKPAHGVIHACNIDLPEVHRRHYTRDSSEVLRKFCEMMNEAVSRFPGGEPPFKLVFENLWWPGLRLQDNSDFKLLQDKIEFENWGICLDTGHLMNTLPGIDTQIDGIDALLKIFDGYSSDLIDAISAMHFHYSASSEYRETFEEVVYEGGPITDYLTGSYKHISLLDQHRPFSDPRCKELVDYIRPNLVIHELPGKRPNVIQEFIQQRSLL